TALPPKALTSAVTIAIVSMRLLFITSCSFTRMGRDRAIDIPQHYATGDERRRGVPGPVILLRSSTGDDLMSLQFGLALVVAWLVFAPPAANAAMLHAKEVEHPEGRTVLTPFMAWADPVA